MATQASAPAGQVLTVYRFDPVTMTATSHPGPALAAAVGVEGVNRGGINPVNGIYYFSTHDTVAATVQYIYAFDTVTNTSIGLIGTLTVAGNAAPTNGDIAFDQDGRMLIVTSNASTSSQLIRIDNLPTTAGNAVLTGTTLIPLPLKTFGGIAFATTGNLYLTNSTDNQLYTVNPNNGQLIGTPPSLAVASANDLASCAPAGTLSVRKDVVGRHTAGDQFTVAITGNGLATANTNTSTGTVTGVQAIVVPLPGVDGISYTLTETSSPVGALANYAKTASCVDTGNGSAPVATTAGAAGVWTITFPNGTVNAPRVVCTIVNIPQMPQLTVTKTAAPPTFVIGQAASYGLTVTNGGTIASSGIMTISDTLPTGIIPNWVSPLSTGGFSCSFAGQVVTCTRSAALAVNASSTLSLPVTVTGVGARADNSATIRGGGDPGCPAAGVTAARCTGSVQVPVSTGYTCAIPKIFDTRGSPTQLSSLAHSGAGFALTSIGSTTVAYNSMGYRLADNFLYARRQTDGNLVRIDPASGQVASVVAISGLAGTAATATDAGAFDWAGGFWIGRSGDSVPALYLIDLSTGLATQRTLSAALDSADLSFAGGYFWGIGSNSTTVQRIDPVTGSVSNFSVGGLVPSASGYGSAWTFGNGNLGFGNDATGAVYQLSVTSPAAATPTFALVAVSSGPAGSNTDGAACTSPTDLKVVKTVPAMSSPGAAVSWTITVTNNGPGISSGFTVTDVVPATMTGVAAVTPGCVVSGQKAVCVAGQLAVGSSTVLVVTGTMPASGCVTNTVSVLGNEADANPADNAAQAQTCTPPAPVLATSKALTAVVVGGVQTAVAPGEVVVAQPGWTLIWTITTTNTGAVPGDAALSESVPAGTSFAGPAGGWTGCGISPTPTPAGQVCTATMTAVPAGGSTSITFAAIVLAALPATFVQVSNTVAATGPAAVNLCAGNPAGCTVVTAVAPAWTMTKTAAVGGTVLADGASVRPGDIVTYTVTATGIRGTVSGVVLRDVLTDVLDDGTLGPVSLAVDGVPATVTPTGTAPAVTLVTSGFTLVAPATAILTYTVTVSGDAWASRLRNLASGESTQVDPQQYAEPTGCRTEQLTPGYLLLRKLGQGPTGPVEVDGAAFALYSDIAGAMGPPIAVPAVAPVVTVPPGSAVGRFAIAGLPTGSYWLQEAVAPTGHHLLAEAVRFTVAIDYATGTTAVDVDDGNPQVTAATDHQGTATITVTDTTPFALPLAGGTGNDLIRQSGAVVLLIAAGLVLLVRRHRRSSAVMSQP